MWLPGILNHPTLLQLAGLAVPDFSEPGSSRTFCWLLLTIHISSTEEEGESLCGGSDKPPCVSKATIHLLAPAYQGLQGSDQVDRKLQEEVAL